MSAAPAPRTVTLTPLTQSAQEIDRLAQEVCELCAAIDIDIALDEARACVKHLLYVQQVNEYMNLTRITDLHEALVLHIVDSLSLVKALPLDPERFLDMGTGAGFPGIPFHILTGASGVLLDSVGKKVSAVTAFSKELGLTEVEGVHARLEDYALEARGAFDLVIARAVGQLPLLIEYATPFIEDDGYLLIAKALPSDDELRAGDKAARVCGLELVGSTEFDLPEGLGHRTLLLYQKVGESQVKLPRQVGMAKRNPVG